MPVAVGLFLAAKKHFPGLGSSAGRLVLSLFFKAVLGIQRIFHFETLDDKGVALLTGGHEVLGRQELGGLIRHATVQSVLNFVRATEPRVEAADALSVSIDEHAIARFTRKFDIRKGFHTIRNKKMKVEKLFFSFCTSTRSLLSLVATRGNSGLAAVSAKMLPSQRRKARGAQLRLILDAGAASNHSQVLALATHPNQVTLVRTPRRPTYRKAWRALPPSSWTRIEEPGRFKADAPKVIHVAETQTVIGPRQNRTSVRTIVAREQARKGKDRWHALWVFNDDTTGPYDLIREFRTRQHHEQRYRVLLHDAFVDTAPSGYNKRSANPARPGFNQNSLTLFSWVAALATNALDGLTEFLPSTFRHAHPRTLRRWLFAVPADIYLTPRALIVLIRPARLRSTCEKLISAVNSRHIRIPWMDDRRLVLSLESSPSEGAFAP
jgi:hypothetical protein